jgi:hypothetical protein
VTYTPLNYNIKHKVEIASCLAGVPHGYGEEKGLKPVSFSRSQHTVLLCIFICYFQKLPGEMPHGEEEIIKLIKRKEIRLCSHM